jgi:hypothetical protein
MEPEQDFIKALAIALVLLIIAMLIGLMIIVQLTA